MKSVDDDGHRDTSMLSGQPPAILEEEKEEEEDWFAPAPADLRPTAPGAQIVRGGDVEDPANANVMAADERKMAPSPPEAPLKDNQAMMEKQREQPAAKRPPGQKKVASTREINPKFKDLQETGKWGEISKTETYIAIAIVIVVVVGVAIGVSVGLHNKKTNTAPVVPLVRPTRAPTMAPTKIGRYKELVLALNAIDYSNITYLYLLKLPTTVADYAPFVNDSAASPQERAMAWLLYEDQRDVSTEVGERWALASLYYGWEGENWVSAKNWLSSESACNWEHITCVHPAGYIQQINLESNNLVGTIPNEIVMLNTTQALSLNNNQLTGTLPNAVFGAMPRLSILYLNNNDLSGTISLSIRDNGALGKSYFRPTLEKLLKTCGVSP